MSLGPETFVKADGVDIGVPGYSVPSFAYWDGDDLKDLLIGQAGGTLRIYLNVGTDDAPTFDGGAFVQFGSPGSKVNIGVGIRAAPCVVDWNNDGRKDLLVGAGDGAIHLFINEGTDAAPDFRTDVMIQANGSTLYVPSQRASPVVLDLDADGRKDLLVGNMNGQLLAYLNTGTDAAPAFSGYSSALSGGIAIDLASTPRSRPFVCDWTGDGRLNVLIGAGDSPNGKIHLYRGFLGDYDHDGDADSADFTLFQACFNGPNLSPAPGCPTTPDSDADGDADLNDFMTFQACFNGSNVSPRCP